MKCASILAASVMAMAMPAAGIATTIPFTVTSSVAQTTGTKQPLPKVRLLSKTQLELQSSGKTYKINASDLNVQVLDALDCSKGQIAPRLKLKGQRFFDNQGLAVDNATGNLAVAVLLSDCIETQVSAVFIIDPQSSGYSIYRLQVPGKQTLPDELSTYGLRSINRVSYLDGNLLVKQQDASGSEALLVFTPSTKAGKYAGCVRTIVEESANLCPGTK